MNLILSQARRHFFKLCEQVEMGTLYVVDPDDGAHVFGGGEPYADIHIHDWHVLTAIAQRGDVGLGETYVDGLWDSSDVEALLALLLRNQDLSLRRSRGNWLQALRFRLTDRLIRNNTRKGSRRNIEAHYDVGNAFYELWLDQSMTYSSALYSDHAAGSLEQAQQSKYARLNDLLPDGAEQVLEIGCGWGGYAEHAALAGRHVTGVTVSSAQREFAQSRTGRKALIELQDYRDIRGKYEAIVSIEMIEAVGQAHWSTYFAKLKSSLAEGGRAALQAIIVEDAYFDHYRNQSDFIRQYTFPGGMLIPPAQIEACAKDAGLKVGELFRFGGDYARTLREWLFRLNVAERQIINLGYDHSFLRSWRYYLQFCAAGFSHGQHINVAQFTLEHG